MTAQCRCVWPMGCPSACTQIGRRVSHIVATVLESVVGVEHVGVRIVWRAGWQWSKHAHAHGTAPCG